MRYSGLFGACLIVLALLGCSCGNTPEILAFEASPQSLTSPGLVTLSWNVAGADSVELEGIAGGLPLVGTKGIAVDSTTRFRLVARRGDLERDSTIHVEVQPLTIVGKLIDVRFGQALEGWTVEIDGDSVVTNSDGTFELQTQRVPYDALVFEFARSQSVIFTGLTTQTPTLVAVGNERNPTYAATVSGHVSLETASFPADAYTFLSVVTPFSSGGTGDRSPDFRFSMDLHWAGSDPVVAELWAVRLHHDPNGQHRYALGQASIGRLFSGGTASNINLSVLEAQRRGLEFALPTADSLREKDVLVRLAAEPSGGGAFYLSEPIRTRERANIQVPVHSELAIHLQFSLDFGSSSTASEAQMTEAELLTRRVMMQPPPALDVLHRSRIGSDGSLKWRFSEPGTCVVAISSDNGSSWVSAVTHDRSLSLAQTGLQYGPGVPYAWGVRCFSSIETVDSAADGLNLWRQLNRRGSYSYADSGPSTFFVD